MAIKSDVFELLSTHKLNEKLTLNVYDCMAIDGRVFGLEHFKHEEEMLITEATFKEMVKAANLSKTSTKKSGNVGSA